MKAIMQQNIFRLLICIVTIYGQFTNAEGDDNFGQPQWIYLQDLNINSIPSGQPDANYLPLQTMPAHQSVQNIKQPGNQNFDAAPFKTYRPFQNNSAAENNALPPQGEGHENENYYTPGADSHPAIKHKDAKTLPSAAEVVKDEAVEENWLQSRMKARRPHRNNQGAYKLRIGDRLTIAVYGEPMTKKDVLVDPTGSITYQFINSMPVKGRTIAYVRKKLEAELSKYYLKPLVVVTLSESIGDYYSIFGEVREPGRKHIKGKTTILSALGQSGGLTYRQYRNEIWERADLERSFLARKGRYIPVDFISLVYDGDMEEDIELEDGDFINIASLSPDKIFVLGEVNFQQTLNYMNTISLSEALAASGGLTNVASSRVVVIRGSLCSPLRFQIDVNRILKGHACDFMLQPGDIVFAPAMKFTTLKEIFRAALSNFVNIIASQAGTRAFISIHPGAACDVDSPVPIINTGGFSTGFTTGAATSVSVGTGSVVIP